jgi:predicted nucleic acid-binding Zn ribbon protein
MKREPSRDSERPCAYCGEPFRPVHGATAGKYCSVAHARASKRLPGMEPFRNCAVCGDPFPTARRGRDPKYCGHRCSGLARRKPEETIICAQCGQARTYKAGVRDGRFLCSRVCAAQWRSTRVDRTCQQCGTTFQKPRSVVERSGAKYCSWSCSAASKRRGEVIPRPCVACGKVLTLQPSRAKQRFCNRDCQRAAHRRVQVVCARPGCHKRRERSPSYANRPYCSMHCWRLAQAPRQFRCATCRTVKEAPAWRKARFCSLQCAYQGRRRRGRSQDVVERDQRILELAREVGGVPEILACLKREAERPGSPHQDWAYYAPATIRSVLFRARQRGHE